MERIEIAGRAVAYRRAGRGPALVLLHGGYGDSRDWSLQLDALSDEFEVIAWDAPGCGGSDDPPAGMELGDYADAVADLITGLGLERAHVGGISFGGGLAIAVYQRHPTLVRSLLLVSAYAGWRGSLTQEEVAARLARIEAEIQQPPRTWVDSYLPGFFAGPISPEVTQLVRSIMLDIRPAGVLPMLHAFAAADLNDVLPTIEVPTLLLYGGADVRAPRAVAETLHARIPGSQLVFLPGVGHLVDLEAPEAFNAEVRRFLQVTVAGGG